MQQAWFAPSVLFLFHLKTSLKAFLKGCNLLEDQKFTHDFVKIRLKKSRPILIFNIWLHRFLIILSIDVINSTGSSESDYILTRWTSNRKLKASECLRHSTGKLQILSSKQATQRLRKLFPGRLQEKAISLPKFNVCLYSCHASSLVTITCHVQS